MSDLFDEKIVGTNTGTVTDTNYIDPYSENDDTQLPNSENDITVDDIKEEPKGNPDNNDFIPIPNREAPFTEQEEQFINSVKALRTLKGLAILGGILWLS